MNDTKTIIENTIQNNQTHTFISIGHESEDCYNDYYAVPNNLSSSQISDWVANAYGELYSWRPSTPDERISNTFYLLEG